jgi:hypothetical protein
VRDIADMMDSVRQLERDARGTTVRQSYSRVAAGLSNPPPPGASHSNIPYTTLTRYSVSPSTIAADSPSSSISLFAAPLLSAQRPLTPSSSTSLHPFSLSNLNPTPTTSTYTYHPATTTTSVVNNFPTDTSEYDLLGMDWDEFGERLLVSTGKRVWEWEVDNKSRRARPIYSFT